ncbi:hypothetical protein BMS3Abin07_02114 [bacterium BMS3Abin07]|nr:hypothetical protein BMS3Abin07_02114 [bacterium BMS3Abin07]GBE32545.1 hypothetical protein BMS3Bbin05_01461 [bacterium BMS3Bbin05]
MNKGYPAMRSKFLNYLIFVSAVVILIAAVKVINWIPTVVQKGSMREYASVDEVRSGLKINDIYAPSYFPESFKWPPNLIIAQTKPFTAIVMEFKNARSGDTALMISQADLKEFSPGRKMEIIHIKEEAHYTLKGRSALLQVGVCRGNKTCSKLSWREGKCWINVVIKAPPFQVIKISESMIRKKD